jgi:hypothetical protein
LHAQSAPNRPGQTYLSKNRDGELMTKLGKHAVVLGASMGGLLAARVRRLKRLLIKKRAAIRLLDRPINGPRSG